MTQPFAESEVVYRWAPDASDRERDDSLADEYVVARPEWARGTICVFVRYENDLPNAWSDDGEEDVIAHLLGRLIADEPGPDSDIRRRLGLADAQIAQLTAVLAERNAEIEKYHATLGDERAEVARLRLERENLSSATVAKHEAFLRQFTDELERKEYYLEDFGDDLVARLRRVLACPRTAEEPAPIRSERDQLRTELEAKTAALAVAHEAALRMQPSDESRCPACDFTRMTAEPRHAPSCIATLILVNPESQKAAKLFAALKAEHDAAKAYAAASHTRKNGTDSYVLNVRGTARDSLTLAIAAVESILKGEADAE